MRVVGVELLVRLGAGLLLGDRQRLADARFAVGQRAGGVDGERQRLRECPYAAGALLFPVSPSQKYEIWVGLLRGEFSTIQAAERSGVDRSTIMKLRTVAKQGALDALAASRPGFAGAARIRSWRLRARRSPGCRRR